MGLPAALRAHKDRNFDLASKHYQRALDQGDHQAILFQNFGSLLRDHGKNKLAEKIYKQGLLLYPSHEGIRQNYANFLRSSSPWKAFELHLSILRDFWGGSDLRSKHFLAVVEVLDSQGCYLWAYLVCKLAFSRVKVQPSLLISFYKLATHPSNGLLSVSQQSDLAVIIDQNLSQCSSLEKSEYYFALSFVHIKREDFGVSREALFKARHLLSTANLSTYDEREKAQELNNQYSWNMGCILLSYQYFEDGWQYFEYGLRTHAPGSQKWQRALPKPFSYQQISLWRGQSLENNKLLLLEEQAIGDVMQFMSLLPKMISEVQHIGILLSNRLLPIYNRSFSTYIKSNKVSIFSFEDVMKGRLSPDDFDFQSPIGSICRHRFLNIDNYGLSAPVLQCDSSQSLKLRQNYIEAGKKPSLVVGISWRGGGSSSRIKEKSIPIEKFAEILSIPDIRFVSLQYGEAETIVGAFKEKGLDVLYDPSIDSLKNMDSWLSQVAACDAVISVANTTIHGAGGLNIPTQCLLSMHSDWRWLKNTSVQRSYWYPSVGIMRETQKSGWSNVIKELKIWLASGAPMPAGPTRD